MEFDQQVDQFSTSFFGKRRCGRKKFRETRHPVYRGVRERNGDKWVCEIREPKKKSRIWLGTYPTAEMAAVAHDVASLALRGSTAALNFPSLASRIPRPRSSSAKDIRVAAQQAAESLIRPKPSNSSSSDVVEVEVVVGEGEAMESFWDEEELFNMPGVVEGMAEGLLLTPPPLRRGFSWDLDFIYCDNYFTLWTDH